MRRLLARRRFELYALLFAGLMALLHGWAERTPVSGAGNLLAPGESAGLSHAFLRALHSAEGRLTDLQFRLRGPRPPHPDVLVAEVDEKSAKRFGLWPWSRAVVARGVQRLHDAGARAIGLDITFTDEVADPAGEVVRHALEVLDDSRSGDPAVAAAFASYRQKLEALRATSPDEVLARVFADAPEVVQGIVMYNPAQLADMGERADLHRQGVQKFVVKALAGATPGSVVEGVDLGTLRTSRFLSAETPLPPFLQAGHRFGFFNVVPDPDGVLRRTPPVALLEDAGGFALSLEVEMAAAYFGSRAEVVYDRELHQVAAARIRRKGASPLIIPVQEVEPYALIDHAGDRHVFPTISFADVVEGRFDPARVRGKAVLVGVTQVGNFDQRVTPFSEFEPGVFTHASFLSNVLEGRFLRRPAALVMAEYLFLLLSALILAFVLPRVKFRWKLGGIAVVLGGWLGLDQLLFVNGLQAATFLPTVNVLGASFGVIFLGYLSADTERQNLAAAFQYRVGRKVMQEMMAHPEKFTQGGERREMSVLFSDIRGFTTLAEGMTPEELTRFINEYLTPMTEIVFEEDGTLDKYIGDAVMAFWGAPTEQKDHAVRACRAALKMLERLEVLKAEWRAKGRPDFDIGVGINSGVMSVGFMGSEIRGDYTVMGDAVNLASRLEGTNKDWDTRILISEHTWMQVKDQFVGRRLGAVRVKGKTQPVHIYELRAAGTPNPVDAEAIAAFEAALTHHSERSFDEAEADFLRVLALWKDDAPTRRYLEEIAALRRSHTQ